ncbi:MAG: carbohydrate ABC transporter substrate-binding protein [Chloroflexi bacterium]|nr:carbohydrate ABC transporter substrate-binding protein [Chloroflexota bacterium]
MKTKVLFLLLVLVLSISAVSAQDAVNLTYLVDDSQNSQDMAKALTDAYTALYPNVTFTIESRPGGTEGDNIVKTRLATSDMTDIFFYNSGSLLQALNPTQTLVDLSDQAFIANIQESFLPTVSQGDGIYGVPTGTAMGGGILYNKAVYEELGLSVPTTWEEFAANNAALLEAGIPPVLATFGDTWTSQLFVLADYYNVEQQAPGFADAYTANEAKYATTPAALAGFQYLQQGYEQGWWQQDYATTRFEQGLSLLANGEVAHFPMLTFALSTIATNFPDQANDIGFFAQPGPSADANGATIWMPAGTYIPVTTTGAKLEAALGFLGFIASVEGVDAITAMVPPNGPYLIKDSTLPDTVLPAVQDLAAYIDSGNSYPALEFLSPIKGPNLEQLCVAVGTGQMSAEEAAANYDLDVERQAQQLGLPGW